ncbi:hypothetical protein PV08_05418 [Exophiala spinifera]|uniref:Copper acquisition factor BIM1-like domain-containing protein n=1 Tax=Exophiala spinifera TaxID=91928 RepID=A0A0D1ZRF1_9EURO|nr:uncharacterized protein PV08_05418 [Exophiala spinifera]KIW15372.1 hypothetical protein PV08_05418 [Exophiala spinifera]
MLSLYQSLLLLSCLPALTLAHFELNFPPSRGTDDENQATFPCGGYSQTQNRTRVSLTEVPVSVKLGHTENLFQVTLAIGDDVGSSFNYDLLPTIQEFGPGDFCLSSIPVPADLNITDGTNATIQVITNSHDGSGLYNCADITFTATDPETPSSCTNGTGISATPLSANAYTNANESSGHEDGHGHGSSASGTASGSSSSSSSSASATAAPSGSSDNNGASMMTVGWGVLGAAVLAGVAVL